MIPLQLVETSAADTIRPTVGPARPSWPGTARTRPRPSSAVAWVLSFGALDRQALHALGDARRAIPAAAREVAVSCDVGVRTFARTLTIRLWVLEGWGTKGAVERLAASIARPHGVLIVLSGDLAASDGLVDEALAASDHVERGLAPGDLASALDRAQAVLWPAPPPDTGPAVAGGPGIPARRWRGSGGGTPGQRSARRGT